MGEPKSYQDVIENSNATEWIKSMNDELNSLKIERNF